MYANQHLRSYKNSYKTECIEKLHLFSSDDITYRQQNEIALNVQNVLILDNILVICRK